ncbi:MAG: glycosyltransferase [Lachnospiraceae bacterium]|nr:glycosyltransferase [Lachnospiraceae bacterium]
MKLLSVVVPCYNSEAYMRKCVDSLLVGGEEVEILIVNDGSVDATPEIAEEYAEKYPGIVRVIHQENGGHGEAVNTGLQNANGLYFKVVDSDDSVSAPAYEKILSVLEEMIRTGTRLDMLISNFVYDKQGSKRKKVMKYTSAFPEEQVFTWSDVKHFHKGQYILMHSVIYRTQILKECNLQLPKHTFYVDNIFVFHPLPYVKTMYYLNVNFYRYFIGRDDQSVNEEVMIQRIDQQLKVNKILIDDMDLSKITDKKLRNYMVSFLDIIMTVSSIMLIKSGTDENYEKKKELWNYLRKHDRRLYFKIRTGILGRYMNLPGKGGRQVSVAGYKIMQKFYGFN